MTSRGPVVSLAEGDFDRGLALNLKSLVYGCQAAAAVMCRGGSIINVGSGTVDAAVADLAAYSIPNAGVLQLARSLARELGPAGIRVNTVSPGYILTGMTDAHFRDDSGTVDPQRRQHVVERESANIPLGRPGEAAEWLRLCCSSLGTAPRPWGERPTTTSTLIDPADLVPAEMARLDDGCSLAQSVAQVVAEVEVGRVDEGAYGFVDAGGVWPVEVDVAGVSCGGVAHEEGLSSSEEPAVGIVVEDAGEEPLEIEAVDQFAGG